jgi:hypothetical protein
MNPIHYKKSPQRKTEKVATPREGKGNTGFPQHGFLVSYLAYLYL